MQVWEHWTTGTIVEIIDSPLRGNAPGEQMQKCVHIGLLCVQDNPADRPMMSMVNVMLSSSTFSLPAPSKPVFFTFKNGSYPHIYSESYPTTSQPTGQPGAMSPNEVSITELEPRWIMKQLIAATCQGNWIATISMNLVALAFVSLVHKFSLWNINICKNIDIKN